ncbi:MAG TPA: FlhC family transcriptional regulator [Steroidobacteraceae bacterium]|nr:FlhC family transcriptional regulator [Steroidobacteraceae bacterium]
MRITDDRYTRDRQRFDLAFRMIHHEARTWTIRTWTGLSDDRIRKLYRSYVESHGSGVKRHRGKSPTQTAFFLRNLETRRHAAALGGLFATFGLLHDPAPDRGPGGTLAGLRWGELFCLTYETYAAFYQPHCISFEHAWHLLRLLEREVELKAGTCPACEGFMVVDVLRMPGAVCTWCESEARAPAAAGARSPVRFPALAARRAVALRSRTVTAAAG